MSDVNSVASGLQATFSLPEGALKVQRATRLWIDVGQEQFPAVFDYLVKTEGFTILCTITGLDLGADLGFIYHLARDGGIMANLKTRCPKGDSIPSVTPTFPGASIYEAELVDLLAALMPARVKMAEMERWQWNRRGRVHPTRSRCPPFGV